MKTNRHLMLCCIALGCLLTGCTLPPTSGVHFHHEIDVGPLDSPSPGGWTFEVHRGDSRDRVLLVCGRPTSRIGSDLWVYGSGVFPRRGELDTLVVAFAGNHVNELRLVNGDALRSTLAGLPRLGAGGRELGAFGR